jgi:FtsH-binding integral membrane protein
MRTTLRLFVIVGVASLITTATYFGLVLVLLPVLQRPNLPRLAQVPLLAVVVLTPVCIAAWLIFRKLRANYPVRTARAAAIAFAIFTPVSLGVAFPLSTIVGAYSEGLAGYPIFGFLGAFVGVAIIVALLSFLPCAFTLWIARHDGGAHQAQ